MIDISALTLATAIAIFLVLAVSTLEIASAVRRAQSRKQVRRRVDEQRVGECLANADRLVEIRFRPRTARKPHARRPGTRDGVRGR